VKETGDGLGQDMHLRSRFNNRNMCALKNAHHVKVRNLLCFGNAECSVELPSGVKVSLQHGEVRCAEEEMTQIHTHTHTQKHYQQSLIITQQQSLQLCDGFQCRQTARRR